MKQALETRAAELRQRETLLRQERRLAIARAAGAANARRHRSRQHDIAAVYWHEVQRPFTPFWAVVQNAQ
jgi:hypothetical protein